MAKEKNKLIIVALKVIIAIFCWGCFIYLTKDVWDKFSHKFTSTGVRFSDEGLTNKELPCFTVCPWKGFKKNGFHYENTDFMNSTFDQQELIILDNGTTDFSVYPIKSIFLGRCYMICSSLKMKKLDFARITLIKVTDISG